MLDLTLFRNRTFSAALGIMVIGALTMGGVFLLVSQYLQLVEGLTAAEAGLLLVPQAIAVVIGSMIAPKLATRFRKEYVLGFGMLIAAAGILLFTQVDAANGATLLVLGMSVASFGMGPQGVLCTEMVINSVPPNKAGAASAMSETCGEFGIAMGIAVFGSIATAVYRADLTVPVPAEAKESLAGAVNVASSTADPEGFLAPAREAFTNGLHLVAGIGAAVVIVFAVGGMLALRRKPVAVVEEEPVLV